MNGSYMEGEFSAFLGDLSSRKMTPGGGSASAAAAALGAALNLMVINYTLDKDGKGPEDLVRSGEQQRAVLESLKVLVDKDCEVFRELMKGLSSGSGDLQELYRKAAMVPAEICRLSFASAEISLFLAKEGNRNLISDVGCAASILRSSYSAARHNVCVNLRHIDDRKFVRELSSELDIKREEIFHLDKAVQLMIEDALKRKDR
ncbi:MAG: hypothetical protein GF408_08615 [Candidatus Omnitrophica bacterium]|nr:hypothetical protein [Candidatus Omnitrophota bacterium]